MKAVVIFTIAGVLLCGILESCGNSNSSSKGRELRCWQCGKPAKYAVTVEADTEDRWGMTSGKTGTVYVCEDHY